MESNSTLENFDTACKRLDVSPDFALSILDNLSDYIEKFGAIITNKTDNSMESFIQALISYVCGYIEGKYNLSKEDLKIHITGAVNIYFNVV